MAKKATKNYTQIITDIQQKKFSPVYFLHGEEAFFMDAIELALQEQVLQEQEKSFNLSVLYGADMTADKLLGVLKRYPMMASYQLVILREAQRFSKHLDGLTSYFEQPLPTTIFCVCYKDKIERIESKKYAKAIEKTGLLYEAKPLYDNKIPEWVTQHALTKGLKLNNRAIQMVAIQMGNNLVQIDKELEKLVLNCKDLAEVTEVEVAEYMGIDKDFNIFEFQSAIAQKNIGKAYQILQYFVKHDKEFPTVVLIANLFYFFEKILKLHAHGASQDSKAAEVLKIPVFVVRDYTTAMRHYAINDLPYIFEAIFEAELLSKGIGGQELADGELVQKLLFKIFHKS